MANIHWTTGVDGFFQNPLSWSTGTVPGAGDNAVIDAPGAYTVVCKSGVLGLLLGGTQTVGGIQTSSNANLQITGDIDVLDLLGGDTTFQALNGTGGGANAGVITVQDAVFVVPVLNILLGGSAKLEFGGTFNNTGSVQVGAGATLDLKPESVELTRELGPVRRADLALMLQPRPRIDRHQPSIAAVRGV